MGKRRRTSQRDRHHIVPRCRLSQFGLAHPEGNLVSLWVSWHSWWHHLFGNMTPGEAMEFLVMLMDPESLLRRELRAGPRAGRTKQAIAVFEAHRGMLQLRTTRAAAASEDPIQILCSTIHLITPLPLEQGDLPEVIWVRISRLFGAIPTVAGAHEMIHAIMDLAGGRSWSRRQVRALRRGIARREQRADPAVAA